MIKDIPGYEGRYAITTDGNVWSYYRNKWMSPTKDKIGYLRISLWKNSKPFLTCVHRLVGLTYIPNPENKACINHIDFNPLNNNVSNLEWCTYKENIGWTDKFGRRDEQLKMSIKLATAACVAKQSWRKGLEVAHQRETWRQSLKIARPLAIAAVLKKQSWKIGVEMSKKKTKLYYKDVLIDCFESQRSAARYAEARGWAAKSTLLRYMHSRDCIITES